MENPTGVNGSELVTVLHSDFRQSLAARLASTVSWQAPKASRGIVIVAGGELFFRLAWHLIACLRGLGCRLPIEIWHLGRHEMDRPMAAVLEAEGVRVVDAAAFCETHGIQPRRLGGWGLKAFALRHCGFCHAMLLDADNVPVRDPSYLFGDTRYEKSGAIFWPDLPPNRSRSQWVPEVAWRNVGLEPVPEARPFESGQILVDRRKHLRALDVAVCLNEWEDEVYQWIYGDKDTFLLAWHLTGSPYTMPQKPAAWRHPAICQHDLDGGLVFQHACQAKAEIAAGLVVPGILNRRFAPDAAAALNARWRGTIYAPSDETLVEAAVAEQLVGVWQLGGREVRLRAGRTAHGLPGVTAWTVRKIGPDYELYLVGEGHKGTRIARAIFSVAGIGQPAPLSGKTLFPETGPALLELVDAGRQDISNRRRRVDVAV